jgi:hypothetical protein
MRAVSVAAAALLLVGAVVGSCYNPTFVSGVTKCSATGACPNDWACELGVCVDVSATGAGGSTSTGGHGGSTSTGGHAGSTSTGGHAGSGTGGSTASGGHGGTVATGGASGTGGATATGGTPGTGGSTPTCLQGASDRPAVSLITDFSDAAPDPNHSGEFVYGSSGGLLGGTARYASATPGTLTLSGGALTYAATLEAPTASDMFPFSGFAVYLNGPACTDASSYTGVAFTMSVTGTCANYFEFSDSDHLTSASDSVRGACTATSCFASQFSVTSATTSVAFSATPAVSGSPTAAVDAGKLTGVQWQFGIPSGSTTGCSGTFTVDNIRFY